MIATRRWLATPLLGWVACAPCEPLDAWQAPESADPAVRSAIDQAIAEVLDQARYPVCLSGIEVRALDRDREGRYGLANQQIEVNPDAESVFVTTMHELCHALDLQHDLVGDDEPDLTPGPRSPIVDQYPRSLWTNEQFAQYCEVGPTTLAQVLGTACAADPPLAGAREVLHRGFTPVEPARWRFVPTSRVTLPSPVVRARSLVANPHANGVVTLTVREADNFQQIVSFDPWTGALGDPRDLQLPGTRIPPALPGVRVEQFAQTARAWLVRGTVSLPVGEVRRYWLAEDGVQALGEGRCAREPEASFALGDALWTASVEGDVLAVGRWEPYAAPTSH